MAWQDWFTPNAPLPKGVSLDQRMFARQAAQAGIEAQQAAGAQDPGADWWDVLKQTGASMFAPQTPLQPGESLDSRMAARQAAANAAAPAGPTGGDPAAMQRALAATDPGPEDPSVTQARAAAQAQAGQAGQQPPAYAFGPPTPPPQVLAQSVRPGAARPGPRGAVLSQTLPGAPGAAAPPAEAPSPAMAALKALQDSAQQKLDALGDPSKSPYTDDEIQQRKADNDRQYNLGLLAAMSGDPQMAQLGQGMIQKAYSDSAPRITDKGTFDPISGKMIANKQYLQERLQDQLEKYGGMGFQAAIGHEQQQAQIAASAAQSDKQIAAQKALEGQREAFESGQQANLLANQRTIEQMKVDATNKQGALAQFQASSAEEKKAAGYGIRMQAAKNYIDQFEATGAPTVATMVAGLGGHFVQNKAMTPDQQQYKNAQDNWVIGNLRQDSGAAIGTKEFEDVRNAFFPQPGDSPALIAQKRSMRAAAEASTAAAAGRAWDMTYGNWKSSQTPPAMPQLQIERMPSAGGGQVLSQTLPPGGAGYGIRPAG